MCFYLGRHEEFKDFFSQVDGAVFRNDVCSVMEVLGHEFNKDQWRLFIDSSKVSLKLVPLHNGNKFPSVPLAHAANMKVMKTLSYCWERLNITNLSGRYVMISWLWHCNSECNLGTQNTAVSSASGTVA